MKTVLQQLKQYRRDARVCIGLTALEVVMEILLPFVTARIIDDGLQAGNLGAVYRYGALMIALALVRLLSRILASKTVGLLELTLSLEDAQAFQKAHNSVIKPSRWLDIDLEIYL